MYSARLYIYLAVIFSFVRYSHAEYSEEKRSSFSIPLVKLIALQNKNSPDFKYIRIAMNGKKEYAIITPGDDYHMTIVRHGKEQTIYAEQPNARDMLNEFESRQMDRVVSGLIKTLTLLEQFINDQRWDRCRYLDSFLPHFLKSFYYLSCTALNSIDALPEEANFPDKLFDISLNSQKTDARVLQWEKSPESQIKLRIATRELIFHFTNWQSKELNFFDANTKIEYSPEMKEAYRLFIKNYFGL